MSVPCQADKPGLLPLSVAGSCQILKLGAHLLSSLPTAGQVLPGRGMGSVPLCLPQITTRFCFVLFCFGNWTDEFSSVVMRTTDR